DHRVLDLADRLRAVVPGLMREMGIGRYREDLDTEVLKLSVMIGEIAELSGTYEGEVGRVEEKDRPFTFDVGFTDFNELALLIGLRFERLNRCVDERHRRS